MYLDVDAIFRLTQGTPINFQRPQDLTDIVIVPKSQYAPYNAQATLHFKASFFALYLPTTVPGRVSDIWRSYISQVLLFIAPCYTVQQMNSFININLMKYF